MEEWKRRSDPKPIFDIEVDKIEVPGVYSECIKPVFQNGTDEEKASARRTLFTCLENGLKLLSPFMPFITEELYQRLRRKDTIPSISVAPYPETSSCPWRNEDVEKEVEFVQKAARIIRSARSDYNIPNKTKTDAYIVCTDNYQNDTLKKYAKELATTAFCSKIKFNQEPPVGCAILTASGQCEIHLLLKGLIEVEKEISKLQKKKEFLEQTVSTLNKAMSAEDYATKVPQEVQVANKEKLEQSKSEIERIIAAMDTLKLM